MGFLKTFVVPHKAFSVVLEHPKEFTNSVVYDRNTYHQGFRFYEHQIISFPIAHADEGHLMVWYKEKAFRVKRFDPAYFNSDLERKTLGTLLLHRKDIGAVSQFIAGELRFLHDFKNRSVEQPDLSKIHAGEPFEALHSFVTIYGDQCSEIEKDSRGFTHLIAEMARKRYEDPFISTSGICTTTVHTPVGKNPALYLSGSIPMAMSIS